LGKDVEFLKLIEAIERSERNRLSKRDKRRRKLQEQFGQKGTNPVPRKAIAMDDEADIDEVECEFVRRDGSRGAFVALGAFAEIFRRMTNEEKQNVAEEMGYTGAPRLPGGKEGRDE